MLSRIVTLSLGIYWLSFADCLAVIGIIMDNKSKATIRKGNYDIAFKAYYHQRNITQMPWCLQLLANGLFLHQLLHPQTMKIKLCFTSNLWGHLKCFVWICFISIYIWYINIYIYNIKLTWTCIMIYVIHSDYQLSSQVKASWVWQHFNLFYFTMSWFWSFFNFYTLILYNFNCLLLTH